ncbi:Uncharacterised protein [Neisseria animaloris]|nr:Uncharacterised protein [Neisseria animaloris]
MAFVKCNNGRQSLAALNIHFVVKLKKKNRSRKL